MHFQMDIADIAGNPACARARAPVIQQTMWKQSLVVYILRKSCLDTADHPLHTVHCLELSQDRILHSPFTRVKLFCVLTLFLQNYITYIHIKHNPHLNKLMKDEWPGFPPIYFPWLVQLLDHYTGDGGIAISLLVHWSPSRHMQTCKRYMTMFKMYVYLSAKHTCTSKCC